eukprot:CAMPEP_0174364586 /NCGR_PEP_ID=MMETSP0811_2-20130205/73572_1 /TAXON_ID=73025 ORGANISM="Eutreptiella gymnastica-like, Strain CCMP1594" /NCGR_SAMPLE_ID=MMETSP0811_2 /ASSEMBLY_ACC=CAM_ASM_000667 /LENGTH=78 /DNA_ID=CAMNT_0015504385 /DNA_START=84 /DNA_END=320 /DNA_ORIENTATION=+
MELRSCHVWPQDQQRPSLSGDIVVLRVWQLIHAQPCEMGEQCDLHTLWRMKNDKHLRNWVPLESNHDSHIASGRRVVA